MSWQSVSYLDDLLLEQASKPPDRDNATWHVSDLAAHTLRHCWCKRKGLPNLRPSDPKREAAFMVGNSIHYQYQRITRQKGISILQEGTVRDGEDVAGRFDDLIHLSPDDPFYRVWDYKSMKSFALKGFTKKDGETTPGFHPENYEHYVRQVQLYAYLANKSKQISYRCWFCRWWEGQEYDGECPTCKNERILIFKLDKPIERVGLIAQSKNLDRGLDFKEFEAAYDPAHGEWYEGRVAELRKHWAAGTIPPAEELTGWQSDVAYNGYAPYESMSDDELLAKTIDTPIHRE